MRYTFRTLSAYVVIAVLGMLAIPSYSPPVSAQVFDPYIGRRVPVSGAIAADDTDIALKIRYIGADPPTTSNSGTVAVAVTTSDLTFTQGVQGAEAATTEFECPVSGALGGVIDVSDAACNTLGEIVDVINASTSWRAVIIDGFRSDSADGRLQVLSATRATTLDGLTINWDTSTAFDMSVMLNEPTFRTIRPYLNGRALVTNPFENQTVSVHLANATSTYGSGTSNFRFYSIRFRQNAQAPRAGSDVVTTLYSEVGGATTVNKIFSSMTNVGIYTLTGEKALVRLDNSAAMSSAVLYVYGFKYRVPTQ